MQAYLPCPQPTESERANMLEGLGANRFRLFLMRQEQTLASRLHFALPQKMGPVGVERPSPFIHLHVNNVFVASVIPVGSKGL